MAAELEDLELDVPGAADAVALFVCRAVVDDALAPAFLSSLDTVGPAGEALARKCRAHLAAKHAAERLARCWGGTAGFDLEESRASIKSMLEVGSVFLEGKRAGIVRWGTRSVGWALWESGAMGLIEAAALDHGTATRHAKLHRAVSRRAFLPAQEYASGRDVEEVRRRLHDLAVPFFHHELVKQARGVEGTGRVEEGLENVRRRGRATLMSTSSQRGVTVPAPSAEHGPAYSPHAGHRQGAGDGGRGAVRRPAFQPGRRVRAVHQPSRKGEVWPNLSARLGAGHGFRCR